MPIAPGNKVDASPTKDFFISMLIKDIGLTRAIIDLVDNCVDGARMLRPKGDYTGLRIQVEANKSYFQISDNCGGIPINVARDYAFRFGRSADMTANPHSIGQFGVGMKRALFKLGNKFRVESITQKSRFVIEEEVEKWKRKKEWEFAFRELETSRKPVNISRTGTTIRVSQLHPSISDSLSLDTFLTRLATELAEAHLQTTARGLKLELNNVSLKHQNIVLLQSKIMKPAHKQLSFNGNGKIDVDLYAGISDSDPSAAGWYIFCNDRLVLSADQSSVTGWGETREGTLPKYHNQFARFRGYAFFDSKNAALLPWNTTKTGVDSDSPRYRATRLEMINLSRPVIDFLNRLDAEKEIEVTDEKPLESTVKASKPAELVNIAARTTFLAPKIVPEKIKPKNARIQYDRPLERVRQVQRALKVKTLRDVGEKTFEYFYDRECES
jgi:hypothetical protein